MKTDGPAALPGQLPLYFDLIRWDRPAGWLLLLWPSLSALWIAADGFPGWHLVVVFTLGTFLMRSAGCCVNDVADREFDKHVKRTAQRPVTRGALSVRQALWFGALLALLAFALVLTTNPVAIAWSFAALAIALVYPYAKRYVSMPQAVLGVAFSFGIPMAFAAVQSTVPLLAWVLLLGNLFWVLAYDTEYAMVDRDDDLAIGMKTSAITLARADVPVVMLCYAAFLAVWTVVLLQRLPPVVVWVAVAAAAAQALWHFTLIRSRSREGCFKAFRINHWLGFTMFAGVVAGYALRGRELILFHRADCSVRGAALGRDALAQHVGRIVRSAFKLRGADTRMRALTAEERTRGVTTASAGNNAQGVALSGRFPYLKAGDVVEIEVEGLGKQSQRFVKA